MTDRLDPARHAWLTDPKTQTVIAALETARPGGVRFVGGCVRNALMGRPVNDLDLATPLRPEDVAAALERAGVRVAPTGLAHGTVTAIVEGAPFEITTLRRDVTTDGRNATVSFTQDWEEDSARRDFRLNAIYADPDGRLFDPQGGVADARAGRVAFIGEPERRIREDYLRILRFFRFIAWYVDGPPDPAGLAACAALKEGMARLSAERVWKELAKLLAAPDPRPALAAMAETGVLAQVLPECLALDVVNALVAREQIEGWTPDPLLRLAALAPRLAPTIAAVADRLKLSNADRARLAAWANAPFDPRALLDADGPARARALYGADAQAALDRIRLSFALHADPGADGTARAPAYRDLLAFAEGWERPVFPVSGGDLVAAGAAPGPRIGATLAALERLWVRSDFRPGKAQLLAAAAALQSQTE